MNCVYVMTLDNGEVVVVRANNMLAAIESYSEHYPMRPFSIKAAIEI